MRTLSDNLSIITIVTTDKCSAACSECCFQCNQNNDKKLSFDEIKAFIKSSKINFPNLEMVVFTGGECTLLGNDLLNSLELCKELNLKTRIVSNGYWAQNEKKSDAYVQKLKEVGLDELNLSTGDNHQEWVPFENIVNALISAVKQDIFTCVSIEQHDQPIFNKKEALKNKKLKRFLSDTNNYSMTSIFESSWIPFHSDTEFSYEATINETKVEGCDTLFNFLGLYPDNSVKLCCELTIDYIQEMILNLDNYDQIADIFNNQINDFLKVFFLLGERLSNPICKNRSPASFNCLQYSLSR